MPPEYYECLECHNVFRKASTQNGKYCCQKCYFEARQKLSPSQLKALTPIKRDPPSDTPFVDALLKENEKAQQNESVEVLAPSPAEVVIPVIENEDHTLVINFEDLSLNEIKDIIKSLLDQVEYLENEILKQQKTSPMQDLVSEFVQKVSEIQTSPICPACEKNFTPSYNGQVFCSDGCAKSVLPRHGIIRMENGKFLWNKKVEA